MSTAGSGNVLVHSKWVSGVLYFYEKSVGRTTTGDVLSIGSTAVTVGGTGQDVDFAWYGTGSVSFVLNAGDSSMTLAGCNVDITGDIDISGSDIFIDQGQYFYLDGDGGGEYLRSDTANYAMLNGTTGVDIAVGGTDEINITATAVTLPTNTLTLTAGLLTADGGIDVGTTATGLDFTGTYTGNVIDFSNSTHVPTGSNGPCLIRAGTYASPIANSSEDQSGLVRLYMETSADGSSYDRGVFVCLKGTGIKGLFPVAGLAEVLAQSGAGPTKAQAAQFITMLQESGSKLASLGGDTTAGMYGAWLKVGAVSGAEASSGSRVAAVWLDNQMSGTVDGEEYAAFITCGASKVDAVFGLETTSSGWTNLFYFDETSYDQDPVVSSGCSVSGAGADEAYLRVSLNGTEYGIPLIAI